jgi:hypothetical protein
MDRASLNAALGDSSKNREDPLTEGFLVRIVCRGLAEGCENTRDLLSQLDQNQKLVVKKQSYNLLNGWVFLQGNYRTRI